jgi:hypothetical protein
MSGYDLWGCLLLRVHWHFILYFFLVSAGRRYVFPPTLFLHSLKSIKADSVVCICQILLCSALVIYWPVSPFPKKRKLCSHIPFYRRDKLRHIYFIGTSKYLISSSRMFFNGTLSLLFYLGQFNANACKWEWKGHFTWQSILEQCVMNKLSLMACASLLMTNQAFSFLELAQEGGGGRCWLTGPVT